MRETKQTEAVRLRSPKELFKFRLEDVGKVVRDRIYLQVALIWLNAVTGLNDGEVKFHSLGNFRKRLLLRQRMSLKKNYSLTWGRY